MALLNRELEEICQREPQGRQKVVITLTEEAQHKSAADLGLDEAEEIGQMGILKGTFTGERLLALSRHADIAEIVTDFDVEAL